METNLVKFIRRELKADCKHDKEHTKLSNGLHLYHRYYRVETTGPQDHASKYVAKERGNLEQRTHHTQQEGEEQEVDDVVDKTVVLYRHGDVTWMREDVLIARRVHQYRYPPLSRSLFFVLMKVASL